MTRSTAPLNLVSLSRTRGLCFSCPTEVRLWNKLRGVGHSRGAEWYFEWTMGPHNSRAAEEAVAAAWRAFAEEYARAAAAA